MQETGPVFNDLIVEYSKIFVSTQTLSFDLAPYLTYLPEHADASKQSPLLGIFDEQAAQFGGESEDDQIK